MNRLEAIEKATQIVESLGADEKNNRGYKVDGWKPMAGPERVDAIIKLATFLIGPQTPTLVAPDQPLLDAKTLLPVPRRVAV